MTPVNMLTRKGETHSILMTEQNSLRLGPVVYFFITAELMRQSRRVNNVTKHTPQTPSKEKNNLRRINSL